MKKTILALVAILFLFRSPAYASTIVLSGPIAASGLFDVTVSVVDPFAGRDPSDVLFSFGFDVAVSPSSTLFLGATSNPLFFDPAGPVGDADVFAPASGFGVSPPLPGSLLLATLHFNALGKSPTTITVSTDPSSFFQGLQFANEPFQGGINGSLTVDAVPEPATLTLFGLGLGAAAVRRRRRR